jgi:hypothetical protein
MTQIFWRFEEQLVLFLLFEIKTHLIEYHLNFKKGKLVEKSCKNYQEIIFLYCFDA